MKPKLQMRMVKLADIRLSGRNPRKMSEVQRDQLRRSILEFGFKDPVTVDRSMLLIDGYHRLNIAWEIGIETVPAVIVDITPEKRELLGIALNSIKGEWNLSMLKDILGELDGKGLDTTLAGLDDEVLKSLDTLNLSTLEEIADDVFDAGIKGPDVKPGDVFQLGNHRLMCGDSTTDDVSTLMDGKKAQMVFTDPPYGVDYDASALGRSSKEYRPIENDALKDFDLEAFCEAFLRQMQSHCDNEASFYICFANRTSHKLLAVMERLSIHFAVPLVWDKGSAPITWDRYHPQHETIFYCGEGSKPTGSSSRWYGPKNETTVWDIKREPNINNFHPTQKPVALPARAILNSSRPGEIVLDLFGGSGSTLIAAEKTNRICYMMEKDEQYVSAIVARWESLTHRKAKRLSAACDNGNDKAALKVKKEPR